jgi:hypothetical protein
MTNILGELKRQYGDIWLDLAEAVATVEKTVGHYWKAELYRLKGEP